MSFRLEFVPADVEGENHCRSWLETGVRSATAPERVNVSSSLAARRRRCLGEQSRYETGPACLV